MRRVAARLGILLASLALAAPPATAQTHVGLRPETRMRAWMTLPDTSVWVGGLVTLDRSSLVLRVDSANPTVRLDLGSIERLEVSRGKDPLLTIGLPVAGAIGGALLAPLLNGEPLACREDLVDDPACRSETPVPLIGAAAGTIVGLIVGNVAARERWLEIPSASWKGVTVSVHIRH
jgi:hypothetical protein